MKLNSTVPPLADTSYCSSPARAVFWVILSSLSIAVLPIVMWFLADQVIVPSWVPPVEVTLPR